MEKFTKALALFILLTVSTAFAQTAMKDPISFKLKNGLNVLIAQNAGFGKIYARLTVENATSENDKIIAQVLESYFHSKAEKFNQNMVNEENNEQAKVTMSFKELNTATDVANFEQALNYIALAFTNPEISAAAFNEMKAQYNGDEKDLAKISLTDVQNFYTTNYIAKDSYLTIAGDINPSLAKTLVSKAFNNWNSAQALSK